MINLPCLFSETKYIAWVPSKWVKQTNMAVAVNTEEPCLVISAFSLVLCYVRLWELVFLRYLSWGHWASLMVTISLGSPLLIAIYRYVCSAVLYWDFPWGGCSVWVLALFVSLILVLYSSGCFTVFLLSALPWLCSVPSGHLDYYTWAAVSRALSETALLMKGLQFPFYPVSWGLFPWVGCLMSLQCGAPLLLHSLFAGTHLSGLCTVQIFT